MADTDRIKGNIGKMIAAGAPEADIDGYLASEGFKSPDEWKAALKPAVQPQEPNLADRSAVSRGLSFGVADEIGSALRATVGPAVRSGMEMIGVGDNPDFQQSPIGQSSQAPTWSARYEEELARTRAQAQADKKARPGMTTAGELVGNLAGTVGLAAVPGVGALFRGGAGLAGNVGKGIVGGAGLGGAQGFAEGEGGFENRAGAAVIPAAIGASAGGTLPVLAKALGSVYEKAAPALLNKIAGVADRYTPMVTPKSLSAAAPDGGQVAQDGLVSRIADGSRAVAGGIEEDAAIKRLAQAIASDGGTGRARSEVARLGEDAFLADTGRGAERLATVGKLTSNDAANKYSTAYSDRNARTGERFINAMGDDANVPSVYDARRYLDANRRHVGETAYGAMDEAGLKQTPRLREMYENPEVKAAIDNVMKKEAESRVGMSRTPASGVEIMHEVKRAIQNIGMDPNGRPAPGAFWWQNASDEFVRELKRANPALADADTAYREAVSLYDKKTGEGWLTRGQNFLKSGQTDAGVEASNAALHTELPQATRDQIQALRVGAANNMRDTALDGAKSTRRLADSIVESDAKQSKLARIFGQERASELLNRSRAELQYSAANNRVNAGSETADRAANLARETAMSPVPTSGGDIGRMWDFLKDALAKTDAASGPVRSRLADLLANPDRVMNAETLSLVEALLKKQASTPRLSTGVAGSLGGNFSNSP